MKFFFDLFPVLLFFAAFKFAGIFVATGVAMAATFAQIGWMWFRHRKVDGMLWASLLIITFFGGATLILHDETFIKWKPTVLYWTLALALAGSRIFLGKNLIRSLLGEQITLPDPLWQKLNVAWIGFFAFMGAINLIVAFALGLSTDAWVNFKLFGGMGLMLLFALGQGVVLSKYIDEEKKVMLYAIIGEDRADSLPARLAARPAHLERLQALQAEGRIIVGGPCPAVDSPDPGPAGFTGSLIVAEFPSLSDAQTWAEADPYVAAGVYARVTVKPFKKVFSRMSNAPETDTLVRERLMALEPLALEIIDDSAAHAGHGSAGKGGHYHLRIVSAAFAGKPTLARHRLVFAALGDLMHGKVHALIIEAKAPNES